MEKRSSVVGGTILIVLGVVFLLAQLFPRFANIINISLQWPLIIVAVGLAFLLGALLGTPPLAIPGSIVTGVGGILYYQNLSGNWESWSYIWALIPGFVGIGLILMSTLASGDEKPRREGFRLLLISAALFVTFGLFFSGIADGGRLWPIFLIGAGVYSLIKRRR